MVLNVVYIRKEVIQIINLNDIKEFLENDDWKYEEKGEPENLFIKTRIKGDHDVFTFYINISSDALIFRISDFAKVESMAIDKRAKLLDLLNQQNSKKMFGKAFLDEDNELDYLYAMPIDGDTVLDSKAFLRILYTGTNFVDQLYPSIMKLVWS